MSERIRAFVQVFERSSPQQLADLQLRWLPNVGDNIHFGSDGKDYVMRVTDLDHIFDDDDQDFNRSYVLLTCEHI